MNILFHVRDRSNGRLDRAPLDNFLWGYVKAYVYTDRPASIDALEDNIEAFIRAIPAKMLERVCQNWTKRMDHLRPLQGWVKLTMTWKKRAKKKRSCRLDILPATMAV